MVESAKRADERMSTESAIILGLPKPSQPAKTTLEDLSALLLFLRRDSRAMRPHGALFYPARDRVFELCWRLKHENRHC